MDTMQSRRVIIVGLAVVLAILAVFFVYLNFFRIHTPAVESFSDLKGSVYLTLTPTDKNQMRLYTYDFVTGELKMRDPINKFAMTSSMSPDRRWTAFVAFAKEEGAKNTFQLQLHLRDRTSAEIKQVTKSSTILKRMPDWSPDGTNIAFMAQDSSKKKFLVPNDWNVYMTDLSGKEQLVTEGGYPKWSPDGKKLIFFKNDGLYLYNTASSSPTAEKKLWNGKVYLNMKLAISRDRDMLAWTHIDSNVAFVFKVDFDNETVTGIKKIDTRAFWSIFSPDGKYLVLQEVDWGTVLTRPRLTAYNLAGEEKVEILDLGQFDQKKMFLTDWR